MKWVRLVEAAYYLDTTMVNISVTVSQYRKRHGNNPVWYKQENKKSYIDIAYIQKLRDNEEVVRGEACDLYFFITEDMGIIQSRLADILMTESEIYPKHTCWMTFFQCGLFSTFQMKFNDRVTRIQEFHRIAKNIKDEYDTNRR